MITEAVRAHPRQRLLNLGFTSAFRSHTPSQCLPGRIHPCGGFSLIELLVVLALLIVLVSLYSGANSGARKLATRTACQDNLRKLYIGLSIYSRENDNWFPRAPGVQTAEQALDVLIPKYMADTRVLICPGSHESALPPGESIAERRISYSYYSGRKADSGVEVLVTDHQLDTRPKAAGEVAFSTTGKPPANNHGADGGNLLFTDGEVKFSPARLTKALEFPTGVSCLNPHP